MNYAKLFINKMAREKLPQPVIDTFVSYYTTLTAGNTGLICEADIDQLEDGALPHYQDLSSYVQQGEAALKHTSIIKLNGGLGTSMGLDGPKCMLPVKNGLSFFDIIINQVKKLNKQFGVTIPLLLMDSFSTHEKTVASLKQYPEIATDIPGTFLQHKYPKIIQETLQPAQWPKDQAHEWNPPGHGDIYMALFTSGALQKLLDAGIDYAFVSNIDNLGATMDLSLLGYFVSHSFPFLMEVAERTEMDKKGGHLARLKNNSRLVLRESAQVLAGEMELFQDILRYRYFNTNTIWINLKHLQKVFLNSKKPFQLPLIINKKNLVPQDAGTPKVIQLETAMGAAISLFQDSQAVIITKNRFRPVKKCDDLLILWSDCYTLTENFALLQNPLRNLPPIEVTLDEKYYGKYDHLEKNFPSGIPSLIHCKSLVVEGDVLFGEGISINGNVRITNNSGTQVAVPDGTLIEKDVIF